MNKKKEVVYTGSTPGTGTTGYLGKKSKYIINTVLIFSCVFTLVHVRKKYEGTNTSSLCLKASRTALKRNVR